MILQKKMHEFIQFFKMLKRTKKWKMPMVIFKKIKRKCEFRTYGGRFFSIKCNLSDVILKYPKEVLLITVVSTMKVRNLSNWEAFMILLPVWHLVSVAFCWIIMNLLFVVKFSFVLMKIILYLETKYNLNNWMQ